MWDVLHPRVPRPEAERVLVRECLIMSVVMCAARGHMTLFRKSLSCGWSECYMHLLMQAHKCCGFMVLWFETKDYFLSQRNVSIWVADVFKPAVESAANPTPLQKCHFFYSALFQKAFCPSCETGTLNDWQIGLMCLGKSSRLHLCCSFWDVTKINQLRSQDWLCTGCFYSHWV